MSVFQRGVLTVAGATFVASALILFNGETIAEPESGNRAGAASFDAKVNTALKENKASQKLSFKSTHSKVILSPPPIGPFQIASPNKMIGSVKLKGNSISTAPSAPQESMFKKFQPSFPLVPSLKVKAPVAPAQVKMSQKIPVLSKAKPQQPQQMAKPRLQPTMPSENSKRPVNIHQQPQQPKQDNQKPFTSNPPVQRYMYVPVPMYQPQLAPQTPAPQMPVPRVYQVDPKNSAKALKSQGNNDPQKAIKFKKNEVIR